MWLILGVVEMRLIFEVRLGYIYNNIYKRSIYQVYIYTVKSVRFAQGCDRFSSLYIDSFLFVNGQKGAAAVESIIFLSGLPSRPDISPRNTLVLWSALANLAVLEK